jgi:hypothetical protein
MKIQCTTSFDITCTGVTGHFNSARLPFRTQLNQTIDSQISWNRARNQQRNWETLQQLISLRTQVNILKTPVKNNNTWSFEFEIENADIFGDQLEILTNDCVQVPMLVGLDEVDIEHPWLVPGMNISFNKNVINIQ